MIKCRGTFRIILNVWRKKLGEDHDFNSRRGILLDLHTNLEKEQH